MSERNLLKPPITTVQLKRVINVQMCTCSVIKATNSKVSPTPLSFYPVYIVENILKIIALGPHNYFTKFWNKYVPSPCEIMTDYTGANSFSDLTLSYSP